MHFLSFPVIAVAPNERLFLSLEESPGGFPHVSYGDLHEIGLSADSSAPGINGSGTCLTSFAFISKIDSYAKIVFLSV